MADIIITSARITPNPVSAGGAYIISVGIEDIVYALLETRGHYILTTGGKAVQIKKAKSK